mmetsp:Transcript_32817/g.65038  ORF Transcript_32817/g.65038 Transcript_32817/m.65038 type:complete len:355 (+) Transcript_32817:121-1185(+)
MINLKGGHVVITGGSSGIGLAVASECLRVSGGTCALTLVARGADGLATAVERLSVEARGAGCDAPRIRAEVLDVSTHDSAIVREAANRIVNGGEGAGNDGGGAYGPPDILFCVAGTSFAGRFVDMALETDGEKEDPTLRTRKLMDVNFFGTFSVVMAFVPHMVPTKNGRRRSIVLTSSVAGQAGVIGYASYSSTKFALRGFAESLSMELRPCGVDVTVAYPPDTDTPGYAKEIAEGKPEECSLISGETGFFSAEKVGRGMVASARRGGAQAYWGLEGWMVATATAGFGQMGGPAIGFWEVMDLIGQCLLSGVLRAVSLCYLWSFSRIVDRCYKERLRLRMERERGERTCGEKKK